MESGFTLYGEKKVQGDFERNMNKKKLKYYLWMLNLSYGLLGSKNLFQKSPSHTVCESSLACHKCNFLKSILNKSVNILKYYQWMLNPTQLTYFK